MIDDWLETDEHHEVHLVKDSLIMHKYSRSQEKLNWGLRVLFAKNTIDNLREEVDKGVREKLEQGWLPGKPLTGYKTVGDSGRKIHVPDPQMGLLMREAFELYDSGNYSLKLLVGTMKEKGLRTHFGRPLVKSQLHRLLSNPFYIGKMTWKGKLYDGKHEPLIGVELFERVQERMKRKKRPNTPSTIRFSRVSCAVLNVVVLLRGKRSESTGMATVITLSHARNVHMCDKKTLRNIY